jgi:hypothetical protein
VNTDDEAFFRWACAYSRWLGGDPESLAAWLTDPNSVITDDAREFLADLARGRIKRPRGRPPGRTPGEERVIVAEVYAARSRHATNKRLTQPHERALADVARARRMPLGAARGIVDRLNAAGITFNAWKRWGRPTFT